MILDKDIAWVRGRKFYSIGDLLSGMNTPVLQAGVASEALDAGEMLQNAATAAAIGEAEVKLGKISTLGITGLQITASITDKLAFIVAPPFDMDPTREVGFRVQFSSSVEAAEGRSVLFTPKIYNVNPGYSIKAIADSGWYSLSPAIVDALILGINKNQWTSRGVLENYFGITHEELTYGPMLQTVLDITYTGAPGTITILGILMDYAVARTGRSGVYSTEFDQPLSQGTLINIPGRLSEILGGSPNIYV